MKKILFVASEGVPFIKTGGLADVVGSLPKYFDKRYFDCRVILPKYMCMSDKVKSMMRYRTHFYMDFMGMNEYVGIMETEYEGITLLIMRNSLTASSLMGIISLKRYPNLSSSLRLHCLSFRSLISDRM